MLLAAKCNVRAYSPLALAVGAELGRDLLILRRFQLGFERVLK